MDRIKNIKENISRARVQPIQIKLLLQLLAGEKKGEG